VIGAGLIWTREHRRALAQLNNVFETTAFCEVSAERRAALHTDFPTARITDSAEALFSVADIDIALVLTPIALNAPTALAALEAGCDVIMEKPIARSAVEGRALIERAAGLGRRVCVAEHMAYRPANAAIAAQLAAGAIGDVVLWEWVRHWQGDPDPQQGAMRYDQTDWRRNPDFPLGAMFDGGIHSAAVLSTLFGQPQTVLASGRKLRAGYGDYDHVVTHMRYGNGMTGTFSFSQYMPTAQSHFDIYGTRGTARIDAKQMLIQRADAPDTVIPLPAEDGRMAMWREFAEVFTQRREPRYSASDAVNDVAMLEATARSIEEERQKTKD
jgi:scyllo-inositol 2-dehydrogenase (NADP+)